MSRDGVSEDVAAEEGVQDTKEVHVFTIRARTEMAIMWFIVGSLLTALVWMVVWALPFPPSWGAEGFVLFVGTLLTFGMIMTAFLAPGKEVDQ